MHQMHPLIKPILEHKAWSLIIKLISTYKKYIKLIHIWLDIKINNNNKQNEELPIIIVINNFECCLNRAGGFFSL